MPRSFFIAFACVVLLKEQAGERILPMWIGLSEGLALMLHLRAITTPRPMTYDLTARFLPTNLITRCGGINHEHRLSLSN
jgi:bifunctional DNase/RNase